MALRFKSSCDGENSAAEPCAVIALNCLITVTNVPESISQGSEDKTNINLI